MDVTNGLTTLGTVVTAATGWMSSVVSTMVSEGNEIMLVGLGIFCVGAGIGLARRIIGA